MTPNYTCEACWCVVLEKYRGEHEAWHRRLRAALAAVVRGE